MTPEELAKLGLGDFFMTESDNPADPGADYLEWKHNAGWAFSLFEPALAEGPFPRTKLATPERTQPEINLSSYNYLGLAQHPRVIAAAAEALRTFGTGACGSPILSGMTVLHRKLEHALTDFSGREQTMLFNSGNAGAIGALSAMLRRGDVAVMDQYSHICLIEGAKLAGARIEMYAHNDPADLDRALTQHKDRRRLVIIEALFSMHGNFANLPELVPVARQHGVDTMLDEAHSILAVGENGRGAAELFGVESEIALTYGTFSKAFAGIGAFLSGSNAALEYLRYFANTYVFSVALPPSVVAGVNMALQVASEDKSLRARLKSNADYFRSQLNGMGISTGHSDSHIVPIVLGSDRLMLYELTALLRERGLFVAPVDYPSVPEDELRFRTCVTAAHTKADLDQALNIVSDTVVPRLKHG